jgi:DNA-binding MarR family transcriptional regulator
VATIPEEATMTDDSRREPRRELLSRFGDVLKALRLFKNQSPPRVTVPYGTLHVLAGINDVSATGCHVKDLATRCALDPSTISRAVAALVRADLVRREADPTDGRASTLALTSHGSEVLDEVHSWYADQLAEALKGWSTEDLTALSLLLQRFNDDILSRFTKPLEAAR